MAGMEITPDVLESLAAKVEELDLTEEEQAVLDAVLDRAASAEVEGFMVKNGQPMGVKNGQPMGIGLKWGIASGILAKDIYD